MSKDSTQASKASSKEAPSCLDGLWDILQQSSKLVDEHAEVVAHTLRVISVMWQVDTHLLTVTLLFLEDISITHALPGTLHGVCSHHGCFDSF